LVGCEGVYRYDIDFVSILELVAYMGGIVSKLIPIFHSWVFRMAGEMNA
jgi:hypothetical protein